MGPETRPGGWGAADLTGEEIKGGLAHLTQAKADPTAVRTERGPRALGREGRSCAFCIQVAPASLTVIAGVGS